MGQIASYRDLLVWQQAMDLAVAIYDLSRDWPADERYGLTSQARRAVVSVAANIAEGYGRESAGSYVNFLKMAQGSLKELETHILLAQRLGIVDDVPTKACIDQCASVGKLLRALMRSISSKE
jgi:four helix bundle protein